MAKRIWSIDEQEFSDPATGFYFTFGSRPQDHQDNELVLEMRNQAGDRTLVLVFERNGLKVSSDVITLGDQATGQAEAPDISAGDATGRSLMEASEPGEPVLAKSVQF